VFEFASRMQIYEAQEAELLAPGGAACVDRAYMREMSAEMSAYMGWRVSVSLWDLLGRPCPTMWTIQGEDYPRRGAQPGERRTPVGFMRCETY